MRKLFLTTLIIPCLSLSAQDKSPYYDGKYFSGVDQEGYIEHLDQAYRMIRPDHELENLSMLYTPSWNGFVEGPTWDAWWIQNSYGPTYTLLPFMDKCYQSFIFNSNALWFNRQGNDQIKDKNGFVGPMGTLCDCAQPDGIYYRQGDGNVAIHDWPYGFTTAGIVLQSELLLINRDRDSINKYLPMIEMAAEFIDKRRCPEKNIFLVGTAGNLLAPSYAGTGKKQEDGTYQKAYLTEISVNYAAGLDRIIELEKLTGNTEKAQKYQDRKAKVMQGLKQMETDEGYFIRALSPEGIKHGVYGAAQHGYFESICNHDALAFRIADDEQAQKIYNKIKSIPGLRPYDLIITNYPSYDDMYSSSGLFKFGHWVNGGHWTTCEARMQIGYYRVGAHNDALASFKQILNRSKTFRMDNNLTNFGSESYQPNLPINVVYDSWGAPGGFMRGLFEYIYKADGVTLIPHLPTSIESLQQNFPIYFGQHELYICTNGTGPITSVRINGKKYDNFDAKSIHLKLSEQPGSSVISIGLGNKKPLHPKEIAQKKPIQPNDISNWDINDLIGKKTDVSTQTLQHIAHFYNTLQKNKLTHSYEYKHAQLILESIQAINLRIQSKNNNTLTLLNGASQEAADELYIQTVKKLIDGLKQHIKENKNPKITQLWNKTTTSN